jgi:hypothetical protein
MIRGIPETFLVLGGFTVLSTIIFSKLKRGDGGNVSQQEGTARWVNIHPTNYTV